MPSETISAVEDGEGLDGVTGIRKFAGIDIACSQPTKRKAK